ncbi:MAG: glycosyltransferase [Phormidium sp. SL48-SHIP]|nr:MAG: glycosyltransferase [Phormidium sp. SL48-SHIP]
MDVDFERSQITLSIIIPVYNEEDNLACLLKRVMDSLGIPNLSYEIICVNDGSHDKSLDKLIGYHQKNPAIKIINLSRNFGKDIALSAGLDFASGAAVIPLDADLQDPPELIEALVAKWREGYDVVYATRRDRHGETWLKRFSATYFYRLIGRVSKVPIPEDTGDFRLMDRRVVEALKKLPERNRFMKGLFAWVGYRQIAIDYDRDPRYAGQSKWNYWKLWNFALDGITAFSSLPLKVWSYVGLIVSSIALVYAIFLVLRTLIFGIDVPGYASLMVAVLFLGGIQLISLGVIGEYLGRVYEEVKGRPLYLVRDLYGFDDRGFDDRGFDDRGDASQTSPASQPGGRDS